MPDGTNSYDAMRAMKLSWRPVAEPPAERREK
jgi:hypothetical protein